MCVRSPPLPSLSIHRLVTERVAKLNTISSDSTGEHHSLMHDTFVRSCFGERGGILPLRRMKTVVRDYFASLMWNSLHKLNTQIKMEPMDTSPGAAITSGGSTSTGSASVKSLSLKIPTSHLKRPLLPYTHEGGEFPTPSPEPGPSGAPSEGSLSPYPSKHKKRKSEHKHKKKNKHKQKHKHRS